MQVLIQMNPKATLYTAGSAAQDLGFTPPLGLTREEIVKEIEKIKAPIKASTSGAVKDVDIGAEIKRRIKEKG